MRNRQINIQIFSLFCMCFLLNCSSIVVPESDFLEEVKVTPKNLEYFYDSIRFEVEGKIRLESVMIPWDPMVRLELRSPEKMLDLGVLELQKGLDAYRFKKVFRIHYEPWMDASLLEIKFNQGQKDISEAEELKVLAKGILITPLLAKVGKVYPNEPIPEVGLYIPTGVAAIDMTRTGVFEVLYNVGSSKFDLTPTNVEVIENLKTFITENPSIISIKITGIQSPESSEGKNSSLGKDRADNLYRYLAESGIIMRDSMTEVTSRWNDWFDFRLLLRDYSKISTQRKDEYYSVLLNGSEFLDQLEQLKKISEFSTVSRDLYPRLRAARVEIESKPLAGLDQNKALELQKILVENKEGTSLSLAEWSIAGEFSPRLQDKEVIYTKMTALFRSTIPYNNLAVVKMRMAQRTLDPEIKSELWEEAMGLLNQASRMETNSYVMHNQGQIMIFMGDYWGAYKKLSDASILTKNKDFLKVNEGLRGALDIIRGDYKLATLRFDYPYTHAKDYFNKGLAYFLIKDYVNANLSFEESVIADRGYGYGYYGLAMVASENGQKEVAIIQLKKAIDTNKLIFERALIDPVFDGIRSEQAFYDIFRKDIF